MSIAGENGAFDTVQEQSVQEWGDFEGRSHRPVITTDELPGEG